MPITLPEPWLSFLRALDPIAGEPTPIFEGLFEYLNFLVLDPYNIALCKLKRDIDRDFQDVLFPARTVPFDLQLFEQRYREELRPYLLGDVKDADYTFDRWIEAIKEDRART